MTPKLLLIADDQEDNRLVFSTILMHYGHNVLLAVNGQQAVEQAKAHAPDLILMDLHMPVMDGWKATRLLKEDSATASIPVMAVTAHDLTAPECQAAGFCAYVRKPIEPSRLARAVELCLEGVSQKKLWIELPPLSLSIRKEAL